MSASRPSDETSPRPRTPHQQMVEDRRALLEAAHALQTLAPWSWMSEDLIVGLRTATATEPDWMCVLGSSESPSGFALHEGWGGFDLFEASRAGEVDSDDVSAMQSSILLSYLPKSSLRLAERDELDASGLRFDAQIGFPVFERHLPGLVRSRLTIDEVRRLRVALEQIVDVSRRVRDEGLVIDPEDEPRLFVRTESVESHGSSWSDRREEIPEPTPSAVPPMDEDVLAQLRTRPLNDGACVQVDTFPLHSAPDRDGVSVASFTTLIVDLASGQPLDVGLEAHASERYPRCRDVVAVWMKRQPSLPRRIQVLRPDLADWLDTLCKPLGVEVALVPEIPELEEARAALEDGLDEP